MEFLTGQCCMPILAFLLVVYYFISYSPGPGKISRANWLNR